MPSSDPPSEAPADAPDRDQSLSLSPSRDACREVPARHPWPGRDHDGNALCETCSSDGFKHLFHGLRRRLVIPNFDSVWSRSTCPSCEALKHVVDTSYQPGYAQRLLSTEKLGCILSLVSVTPDHCRIEVRLGQQVSASQVNLTLDHRSESLLSDHEPQPRCLEVIPNRQAPGSGVPRVLRVPKNAVFEADTLSAWLRASDQHKYDDDISFSREQLQRLIRAAAFRLVDVETGQLRTLDDIPRYFALSYVRGQTTTSTTHPSESQLDLDSLPRTIVDAIDLVRDLGERYLWVDLLCINHDDQADVSANVSAMSAIYRSAHLTIVAASGYDADAGLARRHPQSPERPLTPWPHDPESVSVLPAAPELADALSTTAWNTRAWTYGEHMSSRRCVFFTDRDVFFQCAGGVRHESYLDTVHSSSSADHHHEEHHQKFSLRKLLHLPSSSKHSSDALPVPEIRVVGSNPHHHHHNHHHHHHHPPPTKAISEFQHYAHAVESFTRLDLSRAGDRLDAFAAILDIFHPEPETSFAESGIPSRFLYKALHWRFSRHQHRTSAPGVRIQRDARGSRALPSRAWCGWSGRVVFPRRWGEDGDDTTDEHDTTSDCDDSSASSSPHSSSSSSDAEDDADTDLLAFSVLDPANILATPRSPPPSPRLQRKHSPHWPHLHLHSSSSHAQKHKPLPPLFPSPLPSSSLLLSPRDSEEHVTIHMFVSVLRVFLVPSSSSPPHPSSAAAPPLSRLVSTSTSSLARSLSASSAKHPSSARAHAAPFLAKYSVRAVLSGPENKSLPPVVVGRVRIPTSVEIGGNVELRAVFTKEAADGAGSGLIVALEGGEEKRGGGGEGRVAYRLGVWEGIREEGKEKEGIAAKAREACEVMYLRLR